MAGYPAPEGVEMNQLRQEAIRRAREMQSRAQIPVAQYPAPEPPPPVAPERPHPSVEQMPIHPRPTTNHAQPEHNTPMPFTGTLDFLTKDSERSLLLILLLILMEERADNSLLFALMYLLI